MALVYLNKLRGVRVQEAGVDLANAGRVLGLNFSDSALTYDTVTGYVTIVSGGTPSGAPTCSTSLIRSVDAEFGFGSYSDISGVLAVQAGSALHAVVSIEAAESVNAPGTYALNFDFSVDGVSSWVPFRSLARIPIEGALSANAEIFLGTDDNCGTFSASHGTHVAGFVRVAAVSSASATTAAAVCLHVVNLL